jgi:hypothetical protein
MMAQGSRLRFESVVPTTQASVEAPHRSEPTGEAEMLRGRRTSNREWLLAIINKAKEGSGANRLSMETH